MIGTTHADVRRVAEAGVGELDGHNVDAWLTEHGPAWKAGTPGSIITWLREYEAAGVQHAMLLTPPHSDVSSIDLLSREVMPAMVGKAAA